MAMLRFLLAGVIGILAVQTASAQNLLSNGDFETGDFTNWTLGPGTNFTSVTSSGNGYVPQSGSNFALLGSTSLTTVSQSFPTTPGQSYTLSYYLISNGDGDNEFATAVNGVTLIDTLNVPTQPWTLNTFNFTATDVNSSLVFSQYDGPAYLGLDNVSVVATPEPSIVGFGCLIVGGFFVRNRRHSN